MNYITKNRVYFEYEGKIYSKYFSTEEDALIWRDDTIQSIYQYTLHGDYYSFVVRDETFFIDKEDYDLVRECIWTLTSYNKQPILRTRVGTKFAPKGHNTFLYELLMLPAKDEEVTYIDGDYHNNRKSNLKVSKKVTKQQGLIYPVGSSYKAVIYRSRKSYTELFPRTPFGYKRARRWLDEIVRTKPNGNKRREDA